MNHLQVNLQNLVEAYLYMDKHTTQGSEVAHILAQIQAEYEAGQRGLCGLAYGTAQHAFITARMERMGELHSELQKLVGERATLLMAQTLDICAEPDTIRP